MDCPIETVSRALKSLFFTEFKHLVFFKHLACCKLCWRFVLLCYALTELWSNLWNWKFLTIGRKKYFFKYIFLLSRHLSLSLAFLGYQLIIWASRNSFIQGVSKHLPFLKENTIFLKQPVESCLQFLSGISWW